MLIVLVVDVVKHYWSSRKTEILRRKTRSAFTPRHRWSLWLLTDDDGTSTGMCTVRCQSIKKHWRGNLQNSNIILKSW